MELEVVIYGIDPDWWEISKNKFSKLTKTLYSKKQVN